MLKSSHRPPSARFLSLRMMLVMAFTAALLAMIGLLGREVYDRLQVLGRADSDNGQWVMTQTEVEFLRLQSAISDARYLPSDLPEVRRWFDVAYSRVALLRESPIYVDFFATPQAAASLDMIEAYVRRWQPVIDGPDPELRAALTQMHSENIAVQREARALALQAIATLSGQTDRNRKQMSATLSKLALATAATLLFLAMLAFISWQLYRRSQEQALENQATGRRLQMIISTSPDAVIVLNRHGQLVEFNPAAEAIFGYPRYEVVGRKILSLLFPPHGTEKLTETMERIVTSARLNGPQRFEREAQRADGSLFLAEIAVATTGDNPLDPGLVVAFLRDISARKADQQKLEQALTRAQSGEKAKAEFIAVMSHEMRTPLNGVIGAMGLLGETTLTPEQQELLRVMQVSGEILLGHANTVLDLSQVEAGGLRLAHVPFDLDRLIEDCIANQAGLAQADGNSLTYLAVEGQIGLVRGDAGRVQQILLNLIGNAVKFTRQGHITIEAERLPPARDDTAVDVVEFRVIDTGLGIAEEDQSRIFEDFETVDSRYDRERGGTGLGLGIVRRLTQAMGGTLGVESELGSGSLFWLRLPLSPASLDLAQTPSANPAAPPPSPSKPLLILIIEDNEINRFLLRRYLDGAGHHVIEARDGVEGLAAAQATTFDLVITDISMPRMDGIETSRRIRAGSASAKARIIALTAHALPQDVKRFSEAGIDRYLTKPITRAALMAELAPSSVQLAPQKQQAFEATLIELRKALGQAVLSDLLQRMVIEGEAILVKLRQQVLSANEAEGLPEEAAAIVHKFIGSCATFGAEPLRHLLALLEVALREGDRSKAEALMDELPPLWAKTKAVLSAYIDPQSVLQSGLSLQACRDQSGHARV